MKHPVIAIGLDSADPNLIEKWMSQGHLKNLSQIRQQGTYSRLHNTVNYCGQPTPTSTTEKLWVMFLTGCLANKTGYWDTIKFKPEEYQVSFDRFNSGYDYKEYPPFYALGDSYKVAAFDMPVSTLSEQVNGLQVLGWGGHFPFTPSHSQPSQLLPEIIEKYGKNPVLYNDHGYWWDKSYAQWLEKALEESIFTRAAICRDLLKRDNWDLFLTTFGESHTAEHDLWHLSQPDHPLYPAWGQKRNSDPMLNAFNQIDEAIGQILSEVPSDAYVFCFSVHGMGINVTDLFSMTFLPELLYRFNFPGNVALAPGKFGVTPPPLVTKPIRNTWAGEVWSKKYDPNPIKQFFRPWTPGKFLHTGRDGDVISPYELHEQSHPISWIPAMWYQPLWKNMRAFALPAFSDGLIRINLRGREQNGIVAPEKYDAVCEELTEFLMTLTDGRTGKQIVKKVVRTRQSPYEDGPMFPDADLVVLWHEYPTDVVDSKKVGRVGPLPYSRPGGHREQGFFMAKGPGIVPNSSLSGYFQTIDLAPTILKVLGAPIPKYLDGKAIL